MPLFVTRVLKENDQVSAIFISKLCLSSNDQEKLQSQTADKPKASQGRGTQHKTPERQTKQSNRFSSPSR